ncbi:hypothetical protein ACS0TY_020568 [Phlomoides rotata]
MRRQGGHYGGDSGGGGGHNAYGGGSDQLHHQHQNSKTGYYHQGRHQEQHIGEKEGSQHNNQWGWERDGSDKLPQTAMSPTAPFSDGQGREAPRSYYQGQRLDHRMPLERQGGGDHRSQHHEEDMDIGYEDNHVPQTFEGLEQGFLDDIMKLSKEQTDAEDAENARHRERINSINTQYEEQLLALRARHASRRDEFIRRESQARQQQYQQIVMDQYPTSGLGPSSDPRGSGSGGEPHRSYNSDSYDSYRERGRFPGNARDHGYEPKVPYPRGRAYDTGSRYY